MILLNLREVIGMDVPQGINVLLGHRSFHDSNALDSTDMGKFHLLLNIIVHRLPNKVKMMLSKNGPSQDNGPKSKGSTQYEGG